MDRSQEDIRERVESKRDEFAGGPEPGWQQMEDAVQEVRQHPSSGASSASSTPAQGAGGTSSSPTTSTASSSTAAGTAGTMDTAGPESEHPTGIGQQCFKCGAYNDLDAETCWQCHETLTPTQKETAAPVTESASTSSGETLPL